MNRAPLNLVDFLRLILDALAAAGIEYMLGGAIASWAWGEPRATQDVDLVINIPIESIGSLSQELEKRDMLVPVDAILNTLIEDRADLPIQAVHVYSGFKADLYTLRPGDELRRSAFERRVRVDFGPPVGEVFVHSPEDLILYKLLFFSVSQQSKHPRDIAAILLAVKNNLDFEYLDRWVQELGLGALWEVLIDGSG